MIFSTNIIHIIIIFLCLTAHQAKTEEISISLGENGLKEWDVEQGTLYSGVELILPSVVFQSSGNFSVEHTNTPGGVIEFNSDKYPGWIFPQKADTSENILIGLTNTNRGGTISSPIPSAQVRFSDQYENLIDNDGETALEVKALSSGSSAGALGLIFEFDFNALFAVNRIRFFPRNAAPDFPAPGHPFQNDFLKGYEIFVNDGQPESQLNGRPVWTTIALEGQNKERVTDLRIPTQFVRLMRLKSLTAAGFEIGELQVFAQGYVPSASYVSSIFDFGEPALLGNLRWLQNTVGDSLLCRAHIRTRTGIDGQPAEFTRKGMQVNLVETGSGLQTNLVEIPVKVPWKRPQDVEDNELAQLIETELDDDLLTPAEALLRWSKLPTSVREQISLTQIDYDRIGDRSSPIRDDLTNWSPWSPPYPVEGIVSEHNLNAHHIGTDIVSPGPRRYFQFAVDFSSGSFESAKGIGTISFDLSRPALADTLIGEIFPRTASVGEGTIFRYAIRAKTKTSFAGFDQLEISTPVQVTSLRKIEIVDENGISKTGDFTDVSLAQLPAVAGDDFVLREVTDQKFVISIPKVTRDALVTVEFESAVLRFGTIFSARVYNSQSGQIGQSVLAGNAADLSFSNLIDKDVTKVGSLVPTNLTVELPIIKDLLINITAEPAIFTPNRDGHNDVSKIQFDITNIATPAPVSVELFDLSGHRIRMLSTANVSSGRFVIPWDGTDNSNQLVPPGHYLFRISLTSDTRQENRQGVVVVVY